MPNRIQPSEAGEWASLDIDEFHAGVFGRMSVNVVEVQSIRTRVDLEMTATLSRGGDQLFDVDVVRLAVRRSDDRSDGR